MKIKKSTNISSAIARFEEMIQHCSTMITDLKYANGLLNDTKLGITELNYAIDEQWLRTQRNYTQIDELMRSIQ